jgi:hypothetical protein
MARAGEAEGRGRREVREEADGWAPSVGERERERGGRTGPRGLKGKAGRAGKKKERGGEKRGGPWAERGKERGSVCFFQILLNNFSKPF